MAQIGWPGPYPVERIAANGLEFETWTAGDPTSDRLALLLHGFPEHAYSWRHQLPLFAERGYRVWAPNQRGYGNSSIPSGKSAYAIDHLTADIAGLIDASGAREVTLIAHDWGGVVAWELALRALRPVDRLIICNIPHPGRFREELATNKRQRRRSLYAGIFQLPRLPEWFLTRKGAASIDRAFRGMAIDTSRFPDEVLQVFRENALRPGGATAMLNWYRAAGRGFGQPVPYDVLDVPTLMIWGEADEALGKELTYGTDALVKDFTLRYLPDVSHWVQQEAPEAVNAMIAAWLDGEPVPGATR